MPACYPKLRHLTRSGGCNQFILSGTDYLEVTSAHANGILYDSSSADVKSGANITNLYANDTSSVSILGGVISTMNSYGASSIDISDGDFGNIYSSGSSIIDISDGNITGLHSQGSSILHVNGGSCNVMHSYDSSSISKSGGSLLWLYSYGTSSIDITGGGVNYLKAYDNSSINILGGSFVELEARDTSNLTFYGYDFRVTGGLTLLDGRILGTGVLTGRWWFDDTPWAIDIASNLPTATMEVISITDPMPGDINHDGKVDDTDATILSANWQTATDATWEMGDFNSDGAVNDIDATLFAVNYGAGTGAASVPEPAMLVMLLMGAVVLCLFSWRK